MKIPHTFEISFTIVLSFKNFSDDIINDIFKRILLNVLDTYHAIQVSMSLQELDEMELVPDRIEDSNKVQVELPISKRSHQ